ncbi:hypothetical protein NQU36_26915, partial [Escherichia coli]|uniref:hypothetical protein n=1 Tax=Escherichia coli TaxID=562 RepID=UPI002118D709
LRVFSSRYCLSYFVNFPSLLVMDLCAVDYKDYFLFYVGVFFAVFDYRFGSFKGLFNVCVWFDRYFGGGLRNRFVVFSL